MNQAANAGRKAGNLPAGIERIVEELLNPRVPWREVLRQFVETVAADDYNWLYPSRRYISMGLYLPSLRSERLKDIIIAVDTSISIGQEELDQFAAEISDILSQYKVNIDVVYCDTEIPEDGHQEFSSEDLPLKLEPKGFGGTDFRPPFIWAEEHDKDPACLIYLTDMECHDFPEPPNFPTLWVNIGDYENDPPFGEVIGIN